MQVSRRQNSIEFTGKPDSIVIDLLVSNCLVIVVIVVIHLSGGESPSPFVTPPKDFMKEIHVEEK